MGERPTRLPPTRVDHQCAILKVGQFGNAILDNHMAVLRKVHVPLVANWHMVGVIFLLVSRCLWEHGMMVAPCVPQGIALVIAVLLQLVQVILQRSHAYGIISCWIMSHTPWARIAF